MMNFFLLCYTWPFMTNDGQDYLGKDTNYCNYMYRLAEKWKSEMDNECFTICIKQ